MKNATASESVEQSTLFKWAAMNAGSHPELRLMFHIPNGGSRGKVEAARFKADGVKAGVPDIFLPVARGKYHGIFIEMKRKKGGRISEAQKAWISALQKQGYLAAVCYGWEDAADAILGYLSEKGAAER